MLGLAVTTVAIMGTILMGFALSAETKTIEYDDFEFVSNVSGLFETSQTPEYVQYNPAANWTGYSLTNGGPTGGINYTTSPNANLYPITQQSTAADYSLDISDVGQASPPTSDRLLTSWGVVYGSNDTYKPIYGYNGDNVTTNKPYVATLKTVFDAIGGNGFDQVTISVGDTVIWCKASDWTSSTWDYDVGGMIQRYTVWTLNTDYLSTEIPKGTITMTKATMSATYTPDGGNPQLIGSLEDVNLVYGGSGTGTGQFVLGTSISGQKLTDVTPIYMDPSKGVSLEGIDSVYWSNGYTVSRMDILFHAPTSSGVYYTSVSMPDNNSGSTYRNILEFNYSPSGTVIRMGHSDVNTGAISKVGIDIGKWRNCIISLDLIDQMITITPIIKYTSMFDYSTSEDIRTLDFSGIGSKLIPTDRFIFRSPLASSPSPVLGVINTNVFMDTYGVVMIDPSIDPFALSPQYGVGSTLRVDFRSFALYGTGPIYMGYGGTPGFTINVSNGMVSFNGSSHSLAGGMIVDITKTNDGFDYAITIDGESMPDPYGDHKNVKTSTIMLLGNWYVETDVYNEVVKSKDVTNFDFKNFVFDSNSAILMYLGLLVLGIAVGARYCGASWLDIVVISFAGICGFILMVV